MRQSQRNGIALADFEIENRTKSAEEMEKWDANPLIHGGRNERNTTHHQLRTAQSGRSPCNTKGDQLNSRSSRRGRGQRDTKTSVNQLHTRVSGYCQRIYRWRTTNKDHQRATNKDHQRDSSEGRQLGVARHMLRVKSKKVGNVNADS